MRKAAIFAVAIGFLFCGCGGPEVDTLPESHLEELQSKLLLTRVEVAQAEVAHTRSLSFGARETRAIELAALKAARKAQRQCVDLGAFTSCRDREKIEEDVHELAEKIGAGPVMQGRP
jgi:hypothetical protein